MKTIIELPVNLMGVKKNWFIAFDKYGFTVENEKGEVVDGGHFGFNCLYFTERTRMVELFYEELEAKVEKLIRREKAIWKEIQDYQFKKVWA